MKDCSFTLFCSRGLRATHLFYVLLPVCLPFHMHVRMLANITRLSVLRFCGGRSRERPHCTSTLVHYACRSPLVCGTEALPRFDRTVNHSCFMKLAHQRLSPSASPAKMKQPSGCPARQTSSISSRAWFLRSSKVFAAPQYSVHVQNGIGIYISFPLLSLI